MSNASTRPGTIRLPRHAAPHRYDGDRETGRCARPGCGLPETNTLRHLHDWELDIRHPGQCGRCRKPQADARHQDPAELPDVARLAAGDRVAA